MADEKITPQATPDPNTGDILGAMEAEQANLISIYQLQQVQNQNLESMLALQEFANSQLRQQTTLLQNIYNYLLRQGNKQTPEQRDAQNPARTRTNDTETDRQATRNAAQSIVQLQPYFHLLQDSLAKSQRDQSYLEQFIAETEENFRQTAASMQDAILEANNQTIGVSDSYAQFSSAWHSEGISQQQFESFQQRIVDSINQAYNIALTGEDIDAIREQNLDFIEALENYDLNGMTPEEFDSLQDDISTISDTLKEMAASATGEPLLARTPLDSIAAQGQQDIAGVQTAGRFAEGMGNSSQSLTTQGLDIGGELAGQAASSAIGSAVGAALTPVLGPIGPVVGQMVGDRVGDTIEKAIDNLKQWWENIESLGRKTRDDVIKASFEKIRRDVRDMGAYAVETMSTATQQVYSAWDKNLETVTATMGYTKEMVNTLQDSVAQRLQKEGYGSVINAADYLDELGRVLNANINGTLAEAFAAQNLILEKAVPEIDLSNMTSQFAAIYTNAQKEGLDAEKTMIEAMNQVAGAVKAIEDTTEGNNQFIQQVPAYLQQAQEIVARAGGSVDQVAALTTEMMAAEGPLASLAPQLSGFTGQLVDILTKQNDSTAVALRAIMHDINTDIGISATDFMTSFMEDTKGTLVTAFEAINEFIERNENPAARQEFLEAMESLFGIQGDKLAQLDFQYIGEQLAQTNAHMNTAALLDAQALVMDGETQTYEQQLVANTANILLAQNAVRDTLDNAIMRKLEQNELNMERMVYEETATQSVELAENTMSFLTGLKDIVVNILDPFGLFRGISSLFSADDSSEMNEANYEIVENMSSISSDVASNAAANERTTNMLYSAANAVANEANSFFAGDVSSIIDAAQEYGIAGSTADLVTRRETDEWFHRVDSNMLRAEAQQERALGNYQNTAERQLKEQEKASREAEKEREMEEARQRNLEQAQQEKQQEIDNHDNLFNLSTMQVPAIQESVESVSTNLGNFTEIYVGTNTALSAQLKGMQENGISVLVNAIRENKTDVSELGDINEGVVQLVKLFSTYIEFIDQSLMTSSADHQGLRMSNSDREQIMSTGALLSYPETII